MDLYWHQKIKQYHVENPYDQNRYKILNNIEYFRHDIFNNLIYLKIKDSLKEWKNKKILIVAGDSWSNRVMVSDDVCWVQIFAEKNKFDIVVICADFSDSNSRIFSNLISLLGQENGGGDSWMNYNLFNSLNVSIIIEWSSIIRDHSEINTWLRPWKTATQPDYEKIDEKLLNEYVTYIFSNKFYSYQTQYYSWQLQKYFYKWNIPYYFWMGFSDLVPEDVQNTDMDIRKFLSKNRWFNLYDEPANMLDYIYYIENDSRDSLNKRSYTNILNDGRIDILQNVKYSFIKQIYKMYENDFFKIKKSKYLQEDLHPNDLGHKLIGEILSKRFYSNNLEN